MSISSLSLNVFQEISNFLSHKELSLLSTTCKFFSIMIKKSLNYLTKRVYLENSIPYTSRSVLWPYLIKSISKSITPTLNHYPYYTDGGTFYKNSYRFIDSLISKKEVYATSKSENIILKYCFLLSLDKAIYRTDLNCKKDEKTYFFQSIQEKCKENLLLCPAVNKFRFFISKDFTTCPLATFMLFGSFDECCSNEEISRFYSCSEREMVINSGFFGEFYDDEDFECFLFKGKREGIYPIAWVKMRYRESIQDMICELDFEGCYLIRYFYVLAIDGYEYYYGFDKIEIGELMPLSQVIQVYS